MSLLMDALRRAEENKQDAAKAAANSVTAPSTLKLEPLSDKPASGTPTTLPDLAAHIDAVDADLATSATGPTPQPTASHRPSGTRQPLPDPGRDAVRNAFAAKELPSPSRRALWLTLGLLGLSAAGIGGYVWYQLQGMNRSMLAVAPSSPQPSRQTPALPSVAPLPPAAVPISLPVSTPPGFAGGEKTAPPTYETTRPPETPEPVLERLAAPAATSPIRLVRSRPEVDAHLSRGYQNLQAGNIEIARKDYEQALRRDPKSVDALLGMAAIAQREGRAGDAESYWQQAFEADPKDAAAQAAVIGLAAPADPVAAESRLKTLLSAQPESGPLNFALGNLYSRQSRWAEAQQVYFNAVAADGDNPDYLFNLAVSLDHLRQPRLAAQHYRLALEAAERRATAFDRDQAKKRLQSLQP